MTVAFDASSASGQFTGNKSWTHTPVGTPKGVLVFIFDESGGDKITSVTYGGTAMTEVTGSPNLLAGVNLSTYAYFLGASIPTGAQTVTITVVDAGDFKDAAAFTVTAGGDTEVQDTDVTINSTAVANPSATLALGGKSCFCAEAFGSGADTVAGFTPFANWTATVERDMGTKGGGIYKYDIIGTTDVTMGWTQVEDSAVAIGVAITEIAVAGGLKGNLSLLGVGQ